jgi:hypothetical protein
MKATDIHVGRTYAATSYGRPKAGTSLSCYKVKRELTSRDNRQSRFEVEKVSYLRHDWKTVEIEPSQRSTYTLKSGNFFSPWSEFVREHIKPSRKRAEEYAKQREEKERAKTEEYRAKYDLAYRFWKLTGVALMGTDFEKYESWDDNPEYMVKASVRGMWINQFSWEDLEKVMEWAEQFSTKAVASDDVIELLGDVF